LRLRGGVQSSGYERNGLIGDWKINTVGTCDHKIVMSCYRACEVALISLFALGCLSPPQVALALTGRPAHSAAQRSSRNGMHVLAPHSFLDCRQCLCSPFHTFVCCWILQHASQVARRCASRYELNVCLDCSYWLLIDSC
jgi:hypothetical protein